MLRLATQKKQLIDNQSTATILKNTVSAIELITIAEQTTDGESIAMPGIMKAHYYITVPNLTIHRCSKQYIII